VFFQEDKPIENEQSRFLQEQDSGFLSIGMMVKVGRIYGQCKVLLLWGVVSFSAGGSAG